MLTNVATDTIRGGKLMPLFSSRGDFEQAINLPPSTTFRRGTILGQVTGSANDVQTITVTATGGTTRLVVEFPVGNPQTTALLAYGANAATIQAALASLPNVGSGNVAVTGTGPFTVTFQGALANMPIPVVTLAASSALTGGTWSIAHTAVGRSAGTFKAYSSGNSDGSQDARCVLPYDVVTDAAGYISFADTADGGVHGEKIFNVEAWFGATFRQSDVVGLDAAALAADNLNASIVVVVHHPFCKFAGS